MKLLLSLAYGFMWLAFGAVIFGAAQESVDVFTMVAIASVTGAMLCLGRVMYLTERDL